MEAQKFDDINSGGSRGRKGHPAATVLVGVLAAAWFVYVVVWFPGENLPPFKVAMLGVSTALLAGLFGGLLAGEMNTQLEWTTSPLGKATVGATGGLGTFAFVLLAWFIWNPATQGPTEPRNSQPKTVQLETKEQALRTIYTALRDGDKATFRKCVSRRVLESVGATFDSWFEVWQREANSQSLDQWIQQPPNMKYEDGGWRLAEK